MVLCLLIPTLQGAATVGHASGAGNPQVRSSLQHSRVDGSPTLFAVDGRTGHVVVLSDEPHASLSVLDGRSGALLHTVRVEAGAVDLAVDDTTRRIFVATKGPETAPFTTPTTLYTLDADSGRILQATNQYTRTTKLLVAGHGTRLVIIDGPSLRIVDAATGRLLHTLAIGQLSGAYGPSALVDRPTGRVFLLGADSRLTALDPLTGRSIFVVRLQPSIGLCSKDSACDFVDDDRQRHLVVTENPMADPTVTSEAAATVAIVASATGRVLHETYVYGYAQDTPSGSVQGVDPANGRAFFVLNPAFPTDNSAPQTSPVYVHLLDTGTGATVGTVGDRSISSDTILQHNTVLAGFGVDAVRHRAFAINPSGANGLVVFDPRNGRVIHAFSRSAVFVTSVNLVVDQQTGKVFFGANTDAHGSVGILDASRL